MDVQIRVAEGPRELAALGEWLGGEGELCGRVRLCNSPVGDTGPGPIPDLLIVTLGTGGAGKVLASSLISWLQSRKTMARITVGSGGHHVTLGTQTAGEVRPLLEQILRAGNGGAALADAPRAQAGRLIDQAVLAAHLSGNEYALVLAAKTLAAMDPDRAERIARSIPDESQQGSALGSVVKALIPADLDRARRVAGSITSDYSRQEALGHIAEALAATDPDQAIQLIEWSITIDQLNASALGRVAEAVAATDPERAERIALWITGTDAGESALGHIAWVLAATHPDEAERVAREITDEFAQADALGGIARLLAPVDPDRAERIARSITSEFKEYVLCCAAQGLAGSDPDRAGRLIDDAEHSARASTSDELKALTFGWIAEVLATTDPSRAEHIARPITDGFAQAFALNFLSLELASTDPDRAEQIARAITDEKLRASALNFLSVELASTDPDRAERIARSITGEGYWHTMETWKASALRQVAEAVAATDPDGAERIARSISDADAQLFALGHIAAAFAGTDPDRAERIAWSVTGGTAKQDRSESSSSSSWSTTGERAKAWALGGVARALAATDPDRAARLLADAEQLALSVTDERAKIYGLLDTAKAFIVGPNPDIDGPPGDRDSAVIFHFNNPPAEHAGPED